MSLSADDALCDDMLGDDLLGDDLAHGFFGEFLDALRMGEYLEPVIARNADERDAGRFGGAQGKRGRRGHRNNEW